MFNYVWAPFPQNSTFPILVSCNMKKRLVILITWSICRLETCILEKNFWSESSIFNFLQYSSNMCLLIKLHQIILNTYYSKSKGIQYSETSWSLLNNLKLQVYVILGYHLEDTLNKAYDVIKQCISWYSSW